MNDTPNLKDLQHALAALRKPDGRRLRTPKFLIDDVLAVVSSSDQSISDIATSLGINSAMIERWHRRYQAPGMDRPQMPFSVVKIEAEPPIDIQLRIGPFRLSACLASRASR